MLRLYYLVYHSYDGVPSASMQIWANDAEEAERMAENYREVCHVPDRWHLPVVEEVEESEGDWGESV